jgi:adenosylcobyric acid synthase
MQKTFRHAHTLMVQGATSDAGKSVLVTGLARLLHQRGISVAPFKPQNMALNSAVTATGGEIGRAQAVQAEACGLIPSNDMNPVLLKPNSATGSQVIVHGKAIGNYSAQAYQTLKPQLLSEVVAAHARLQHQYDVVLVEGAGSPAEVNLRAHDIANMGFAEAIDCPVIIVADIDRGGVFAHLYGTHAVLSPTEQARIQGFVINRFRGDRSLLTSGLEWLEQKTGVPVLAVIPYLPDLHIEAEDSMQLRQYNASNHLPLQSGPPLRVAVVQVPRISNHTDFDVLRLHAHIECQFVQDPAAFRGADLIILPGSKNVREDLQWLHTQGWPAVLQRHLRWGGKLLGICGGLQMLGEQIADPNGVESTPGTSLGLGYLALSTELTGDKILRRVQGQTQSSGLAAAGLPVQGYEIHTGRSSGPALKQPLFVLSQLECPDQPSYSEGAYTEQVCGTYVHGCLDQPELLGAILTWAGASSDVPALDYTHMKHQAFDRLAQVLADEFAAADLARLVGLPEARLA